MKRKPYELAELIRRWEREQITTEQAIGQIMLWLVALAERVIKLEANRQRVNRSNEHSEA
jgi:hypothetical protein